MPLDVLFQCGLLLVAVVTAFAVSAVVGMLVAGLGTTLRSPSDASDGPGPLPWQPDPADDRAATLDLPRAGAARRIAEALGSVR